MESACRRSVRRTPSIGELGSAASYRAARPGWHMPRSRGIRAFRGVHDAETGRQRRRDRIVTGGRGGEIGSAAIGTPRIAFFCLRIEDSRAHGRAPGRHDHGPRGGRETGQARGGPGKVLQRDCSGDAGVGESAVGGRRMDTVGASRVGWAGPVPALSLEALRELAIAMTVWSASDQQQRDLLGWERARAYTISSRCTLLSPGPPEVRHRPSTRGRAAWGLC